MTTDPTDQELKPCPFCGLDLIPNATQQGHAEHPSHEWCPCGDFLVMPKGWNTRADRLEARSPQPDLKGLIKAWRRSAKTYADGSGEGTESAARAAELRNCARDLAEALQGVSERRPTQESREAIEMAVAAAWGCSHTAQSCASTAADILLSASPTTQEPLSAEDLAYAAWRDDIDPEPGPEEWRARGGEISA